MVREGRRNLNFITNNAITVISWPLAWIQATVYPHAVHFVVYSCAGYLVQFY